MVLQHSAQCTDILNTHQVDLARGRAVMVMAPHAMGVSECIHRAGVQATVVAPEHGLTACGLRDLHHHHAQAAAQGLHVGVVIGACRSDSVGQERS